jgi:hypothetical protein
MSYLEPGPMPRRHLGFLLGLVPLGLLMVLDAFKVVKFGFAGPLLIFYVSIFGVWDARLRKREQGPQHE